MTASIVQTATGSVLNDYGLDNIFFSMQGPSNPSVGSLGNSLVAFIGWDIAFFSYQSSGKSPAVNVTDSAGNLWRQIGITTINTGSRCAIWMAINAQQVSWISVAVSGWAYSTTYVLAEVTGLPSTMQQVSIDFVEQAVTNSAVTTLTVPSGTATTNDVCFAVLGVGTNASSFSVPSGWTGIGSAPVSPGTFTETIGTYWIPSQAAGTVAFAPTWTTSGPAAGVIVGLKQVAAAPAQTNPNFPRVIVEAAFGADPGDWTQSTDYTYSVEGITWTDITSRCIGPEGDDRIQISRGRQYELTSEESGEIDITLDNHDGVFTAGNTSSPYYPNVVPGVPIRVTAWWTQTTGNPIQYPVGFGYVERWPQVWPELPQWGFTSVIAVDSYGILGSTNLPSAVEGDIRKDVPYAYFPTDEQYSFTQTSLELQGVKTPIDANGFIAINKAFGNNRVGAYRDGSDGIPANTGSAINLLGDEDTVFGYSSYPGQVSDVGGPAMFYSDPNIPTNSSGSQAFSIEFWFLLGWPSNSFSNTLMSVFGRPSTYYDTTNSIPIGAVITVAVNLNKTVGLWVNGTNVATATTSPAFSATNVNPQHFVISNSPANGTTVYLNGQKCATQPTNLVSIPQIRAVVLGSGRYSYDCNARVNYQGYNFASGHLAIYPQELTPTMIQNHYASGFTGYVGVSAARRFSQVLTWGLLGLKRGGTAWVQNHGTVENTQMSEAYSYEGTTAGDVMGQLTQTEGGRCFTTANGSLVYAGRWNLYNQPQAAIFGDSISFAGGNANQPIEIPFLQDGSFSVDNTFIYNQVNATQNRGPNTDIFYQFVNSASQLDYFNRSGLQIQSYAMSPYDVYGAVNWDSVKYNNPVQRVDRITINAAAAQGKQPATFAAILNLDLQDSVMINRRPIGGATMSVAGPIQKIKHSIGADKWQTEYQVTPRFPDNAVLTANDTGWSFSTTGTPTNGNYFIVTTAQSLSIHVGDQFTDTKNAGVTFTVVNLGPPSGGDVDVSFTPTATTVMSSSDTVSQVPFNTLGANYLAW